MCTMPRTDRVRTDQKGSCRCRSLTQNCLRRRMSTHSSQHVLTTGHEPGRNSKLLAVTSSARVGDQASTSTDHLAVGHSNSVEHPEPVTKSWQRPRGSAVIRTAPARCSAMSSAATTIRNDHVGRPLGFAVAHLPLPLRLAAAHTDRSATPQPSPSSPYSLVLSEYGPPPSRMWLG